MGVIEDDLQEGKDWHAKKVFYLAVVGMLADPDVLYGISADWRCTSWFLAFNLLRCHGCTSDKLLKNP